MFFDEDDGDFSPPTPSGGSKLASLFGLGGGARENESLTYTAPKQPKAKDDARGDQKGSAPSLLNAAAVHTFKYVNGQYAKQGKLGMAVLGDHKNKDYKILLYVSQKQPVAAAKIHPNFTYTVQKSNYASFYDDQSQMWSVCFDNGLAANEFCKWVALAKFSCSSVGLMIQDLQLGDGQDVQKGDNVELQYTGHLYTNHSFGKMFETNKDSGKLYKMKVGKGKVIKGWEEGVPGMKKGGKRLLIIPPGLAYGSKAIGDRIPANSTLIFEIDVTRAKFANPDPKFANVDSANENSPTNSANDQSVPAIAESKEKAGIPLAAESKNIDVVNAPSSRRDSEKTEQDLSAESPKGRTHSLSEKLSKSLEKTSGKVDLLARMSKMGQAIIASPQISVEDQETIECTSAENSEEKKEKDSHQDEATNQFEAAPKPVIKPRPEHSASNPRNSNESLGSPKMPRSQEQSVYGVSESMTYPQQQLVQPPAIYQPSQQMYGMQMPGSMPFIQTMPTMQAMPTSTAHSSGEMSLLLSESKIHHGEIKSAVTRVTERIDDLIHKVDRLEKNEVRQETAKSIMPSGTEMEASVLAANINRILQENEKLKTECGEKSRKIESLNEKISEMLFKSQSFLERSNQLMEERADSIKSNTTQAMTKMNGLEQENASLTSQLSALTAQMAGHEAKLEEARTKENDLKSRLKRLKDEKDSASEKLESASTTASDHKEELEKLQNKYKEERQERKKLKNKMEHLEEEIQEVKHEKESIEKVLTERKKKQQSDRKKFDEEMDELKSSHEEEINSLKKRYKTGSIESEKANEMKLLEDRNAELSKIVEDLQNAKIEANEMTFLEDRNAELSKIVEDLQNAKIEAFSKANQEIENLKMKMKALQQENESIKSEVFERGFAKGKSESTKSREENEDESNVADEVKKVMNGVFFRLKTEFEPAESYTGKDVIKEILSTIRDVTLKMTEKQTKGESDEDEEDDDEAEDEEVGEEDTDDEDEEAGEEDSDDEDEEAGEEDSDDEEEEEAGEENAEDGDKDEYDRLGKGDHEEDKKDQESSSEFERHAEKFSEDIVKEGEDEKGETSLRKAAENEKKSSSLETSNIEPTLTEEEHDVMDDGNPERSNEGVSIEENEPCNEGLQKNDTENKEENCEEEDEDESDDHGANAMSAKEDYHGARADGNEEVNDSCDEDDSPIENEQEVEAKIERRTNDESDEEDFFMASDTNNDKSKTIGNSEQDLAVDTEMEPENEALVVDTDSEEIKGNEETPAIGISASSLIPASKSLFQDDDSDDDDDSFSSSKAAKNSKKPGTSAFSRSPPPLFDDDDEDTNWI